MEKARKARPWAGRAHLQVARVSGARVSARGMIGKATRIAKCEAVSQIHGSMGAMLRTDSSTRSITVRPRTASDRSTIPTEMR